MSNSDINKTVWGVLPHHYTLAESSTLNFEGFLTQNISLPLDYIDIAMNANRSLGLFDLGPR